MYNGWGYGAWFWVMIVFMILFWIAVIGGIIWLIVYLARRPGGGPSTGGAEGPETALDILNKRYARGEITREDYERMKREIAER